MNAQEIRNMRNEIREMQAIVDSVSNDAARKMFETMTETGEAYTASELSKMTGGILVPSQTRCAVCAISVLNPRFQPYFHEYDDCDFGKKRVVRRSMRQPKTKFTAARDFIHLDVKQERKEVKSFSIACDKDGFPLEGAKTKTHRKTVNAYKLVNHNQE